jgi:hypothetical protein
MSIDQLFKQTVTLIGAGAVPALERLLTDHPELARERLAAPGPWLRDKIGGALDRFFKDPYLLWFVAEDVPVLGRLPKNIADVTRAILRAARGAPGCYWIRAPTRANPALRKTRGTSCSFALTIAGIAKSSPMPWGQATLDDGWHQQGITDGVAPSRTRCTQPTSVISMALTPLVRLVNSATTTPGVGTLARAHDTDPRQPGQRQRSTKERKNAAGLHQVGRFTSGWRETPRPIASTKAAWHRSSELLACRDLPETSAGDHHGAPVHYSHPTLVRGYPPCSASSATPPAPATA